MRKNNYSKPNIWLADTKLRTSLLAGSVSDSDPSNSSSDKTKIPFDPTKTATSLD